MKIWVDFQQLCTFFHICYVVAPLFFSLICFSVVNIKEIKNENSSQKLELWKRLNYTLDSNLHENKGSKCGKIRFERKQWRELTEK